jgi:IMP dehydrogenase
VAVLAAQIIGGVQSGFYYIGIKTISEAWQKAEFRQITQASLNESHPHDLFITEAGGITNPFLRAVR